MHYKAEITTKSEFVSAVTKFVRTGDGRKIRIPQARERFGDMPVLPYAPEEVEAIANWLWDDLATSCR